MSENSINKRIILDTYREVAGDVNRSVDPFAGNATIATLYRQAERLALATYAVSEHIPSHEGTRTTVRQEARRLLSLTLALYVSREDSFARSVHATLACVRHILSLLDILHISGSISDMNIEVLKHAYGVFARRVTQLSEAPTTDEVEVRDEFFVSVSPTEHHAKTAVKDIKDKSHNGHILTDIIKDTSTIKDKKHKSEPKSKSIREKRRLSNRRMQVIDAVAKLGPASVAEIAREVPDCSIKTLQRELVALVRDNVLVREGEKRWTTYSIAS